MKNNLSEISFYRLTTLPIQKAAPKLIEKIYYSGQRLVVIAENEAMMKTIDDGLWAYSTKHFIPHATNLDEHKEDQPVYITTRYENPNDASILMMVGLSPEIPGQDAAHLARDDKSVGAAHPTRDDESGSAAHPARDDESRGAAHSVRDDKSVGAAHPARDDESGDAAHSAKDDSTPSSSLTRAVESSPPSSSLTRAVKPEIGDLINSANLGKLEKLIYLFDGNDQEQLEFARKKWKLYQNSGANLVYWQQNMDGVWEKVNN